MDASQILVARGLDPNACGLFVFWSLSGAIDYDALRAAWDEAGLDEGELLSPPSPSAAVKRALRQFKDRGVMVKPIALQQGEEGEEGYTLVHQKIGPDGRPVFSNGIEVILKHGVPEVHKADEDDALSILQTFNHYRRVVIDDDLSVWLVRLIYTCKATALRPSGSIYFVPREHTERWRRIVDAIKSVSESRIYGSPALDTKDSLGMMNSVLDAAVDAIQREVLEEVEKWDRELDDVDDGNVAPMTPRKVHSRKAAVSELSGKLHTYESLVGRRLDALRERIVDVDSRLGGEALRLMDI